MRIEFIYRPGNTEVQLVDTEIGGVLDRFWTNSRRVRMEVSARNRDGLNAAEAFALLEVILLPPDVGGAWGEHHDAMRRYRAKHPAKIG
jgi:hypothetical protein